MICAGASKSSISWFVENSFHLSTISILAIVVGGGAHRSISIQLSVIMIAIIIYVYFLFTYILKL